MEGIVTAAVKGNFIAIELRTRLGGNVNNSGRAVAKLGRQSSGDQRDGIDQVRINFLPETIETLRQQNAVEAILHVAVIAANMHFPEFILHHARRLQQHLLKRGVLTLTHRLNLVRADFVGDRSQAGRDLLARRVQIASNNYRLKLHRRICSCCIGALHQGGRRWIGCGIRGSCRQTGRNQSRQRRPEVRRAATSRARRAPSLPERSSQRRDVVWRVVMTRTCSYCYIAWAGLSNGFWQYLARI